MRMSENAERAVAATVTGLVQGVSFRARCADTARSLGLGGWVRNDEGGSLSLHAEGGADAVESLVDWCHDGPDAARVDDVEVRDVAPEGFTSFDVRR